MVLPRSLLTHSLSCTSSPVSHLTNKYIIETLQVLPNLELLSKKTKKRVKGEHIETPVCSGSSSAHFITARFHGHSKGGPTRVRNSGRLVREPPTRGKLGLPGVVHGGGEEEERRLHVVLLCLCPWLPPLAKTHLISKVRRKLLWISKIPLFQ